jgi:hypothetical protein
MSRHRFPSNNGVPYRLQDGGMPNRRLRIHRSVITDSGQFNLIGRWSHAQAAGAVVVEEQPLIGSPGRPRTRENFAEFVAQQHKLRSGSWASSNPSRNSQAPKEEPWRIGATGKPSRKRVNSVKSNKISKLAEAASPDQHVETTMKESKAANAIMNGPKVDEAFSWSSAAKTTKATRKPSSQKLKKRKAAR